MDLIATPPTLRFLLLAAVLAPFCRLIQFFANDPTARRPSLLLLLLLLLSSSSPEVLRRMRMRIRHGFAALLLLLCLGGGWR